LTYIHGPLCCRRSPKSAHRPRLPFTASWLAKPASALHLRDAGPPLRDPPQGKKKSWRVSLARRREAAPPFPQLRRRRWVVAAPPASRESCSCWVKIGLYRCGPLGLMLHLRSCSLAHFTNDPNSPRYYVALCVLFFLTNFVH
jgi:hypothetical protein